jgi:hypothetical protein
VIRAHKNNWKRPTRLRDAVGRDETSEDIGYNLADFLDHVNFIAKQRNPRARIIATIRDEPHLTGDAVQDSYLAAVAAHLAAKFRAPAPRWTQKKSRRLQRPWFALPDPIFRAELLRSSPAAFRERNLFTTEDALHRA